jgi:hypothetical protein
MKWILLLEDRLCCGWTVGNVQLKAATGKINRKWKDNIKLHLIEIWSGGVDFNHVAQNRVQWRDFTNDNTPYQIMGSYATMSFSRYVLPWISFATVQWSWNIWNETTAVHSKCSPPRSQTVGLCTKIRTRNAKHTGSFMFQNSDPLIRSDIEHTFRFNDAAQY